MCAKRIMTRCVLLLVMAMTAGVKSHAESDFQSWNALALTGNADDKGKWQFWFDGHLRFKDDASRLGVSIVRPGVGYQLSSDTTLWLGVARVTIDSDSGSIEEDRVWQQATYSLSKFMGGTISGRSRLEQRFRSDEGGDTGYRFRQFIRWSKPLNEQWSMVVWDEVFLGLNDTDWGQNSGFDQNRLYVGPAYHLNKKWRVEMGYLHNHIASPGANSDAITNHNLALTFFGSW